MEKIGIITLDKENNFGGSLQNYAVQSIIKKLGFKPENILDKTRFTFIEKISNIFLLEKNINLSFLFKKKNEIDTIKRDLKFNQFNKKHVKNADFVIDKNGKNFKYTKDYYRFIVGSDQVWNPYFTKLNPNYFLRFANKDKRISLSASFGVENLPPKTVGKYKEYLSGFNNISVREEEGKSIVDSLDTGANCEVHIDPTMAIEIEEWNEISKNVELPNKKYIFLYFLGETPENVKEFIELNSEKENLIIIDINDINSISYNSGPIEFINYIKNSEYVFTDSFHATIFSILYDKKFNIIKRKDQHKSMESRIKTLVKKFNLESNFINSDEKIDKFIVCDSIVKNSIINYEKDKLFRFLRKDL